MDLMPVCHGKMFSAVFFCAHSLFTVLNYALSIAEKKSYFLTFFPEIFAYWNRNFYFFFSKNTFSTCSFDRRHACYCFCCCWCCQCKKKLPMKINCKCKTIFVAFLREDFCVFYVFFVFLLFAFAVVVIWYNRLCRNNSKSGCNKIISIKCKF